MTAFHEVLFPLDVALKSAGGPERRTDIVSFGSGRGQRNARWAHSRRRYAAATRRQLSAPVRTITGADTIIASDIGKTLILNSASAFTMAIAAATTLGSGFWCDIRNVGTALVTLDPNSSETIDGKTTLTVGLGEAMRVVCNGTSFYTDASKGKLVELGRVTNPATAQVDFDFASGWPADFDEFEIHVINVMPATNDVYLGMRIKTTASLTVQTTGYVYAGHGQGPGGGTDTGSSINSVTDRIALTRTESGQGVGNSAGSAVNGVIAINQPNSSNVTQTRFSGSYIRSDGIGQLIIAAGCYGSAVAWTGVRLLMSAGNFGGAGSVVLLARRK